MDLLPAALCGDNNNEDNNSKDGGKGDTTAVRILLLAGDLDKSLGVLPSSSDDDGQGFSFFLGWLTTSSIASVASGHRGGGGG